MLQADLKVLGGKFQGKAIPLTTKRFLVGREQDCHLRPNSDSVSRHHCVFIIDDYGVRLRDLGSTNGTRVNGELIRHETVLKNGDEIQIGKLSLELALREVAQPEPQPVDQSAAETKTSVGTPEFEAPASQSGTETLYEIPAVTDQAAANFASDTAILGAGAAPQYGMPQFAPPQGYPAYQPQMPVGAIQPVAGYPMPPGYPGYPQANPLAPPAAGYAGGYPAAQPVPMAPEAAEPSDERDAATMAPLPVRLPPPESTGVREAPPPQPGAAAAAPSKDGEKPSQSAADIIKQYMQRRTTR